MEIDNELRREIISKRFPFNNTVRICMDSSGYLVCTRAKGHDGPHVAHGIDSKALAIWEQQ
jgi:hypothetical protein